VPRRCVAALRSSIPRVIPPPPSLHDELPIATACRGLHLAAFQSQRRGGVRTRARFSSHCVHSLDNSASAPSFFE
jgi:hypothetical protein